jgi:23S rRNA (adenine2503-C2)-methyltransferase
MSVRTLHDHSPAELEQLVRGLGEPSYRGRQLARGLFARAVADLAELTDLPVALRSELASRHGLTILRAAERQHAADGSVKYLFELHDGARIEAVAIARDAGEQTLCLSSQVGCRMACVFCATARMGLLRNLAAGEIVAQVLELRRRHPTDRHPNLVFMGMGEPLDNFDELARALAILTDPGAVGLGARHITVSTSGVVAGIRRLQELGKPYGLAISVTTAHPGERRNLMPVAGAVSLEELLAAGAAYGRATRRKVTLECALIAGVNDREEDARRLLRLASSGPFKVNLIPLNPIEGYAGGRPQPAAVDRFVRLFWDAGIVATVRESAGREVGAACGQLVQRRTRRGAPPATT